MTSLLLVTALPAQAQFRIPIRKPSIPVPSIPTPSLPIPDVRKLLEGEPPISTSFADAGKQNTIPDNFPTKTFKPLTDLPRGHKGGFLLRPGFFELLVQSYCLRPGTYGPSKGRGYLNAPLKGSKAKIVRKILQNSVLYPEISQKDIQVLLWAIIARTKVSDMQPRIQKVAAKLLTGDEIFQLNGGALGLIPPQAFAQATASLPSSVRKVLEAEASIRKMLTQSGGTSFQELERIAVLVGELPREGTEVPSQRWSLHPQGFYVRYLPSGYSKTLIQVYVPENFNNRSKNTKILLAQNTEAEYDPSGDVAVPANTSSQRLGMSGRPVDGGTPTYRDAGTDRQQQPPPPTPPRTGNTLTEIPNAPTKRTIFCNPTVREVLDRDWAATRSDNKERARWVFWNSVTGEFTVSNVIVGEEAEVNPGATPPDRDGIYVVGVYHTHPPINNEPGTLQLRGPSVFGDIMFSEGRRIPSLVRDYTDNSLTQVQDTVYGPERRGETQPGESLRNNTYPLRCGS
ncbi:MAG: hypothetical protein IGS39_03720 [Calothrix sp. C42_A2020_038]|nr:hypothetical protein [Calothrix sp. C42_A2020_038]